MAKSTGEIWRKLRIVERSEEVVQKSIGSKSVATAVGESSGDGSDRIIWLSVLSCVFPKHCFVEETFVRK